MAANPWDQRPEESDAAFARFAIYKGLGPSRSLIGAYRLYCDTASDQAPKGTKRSVPGSWREESAKHEWVSRAQQWDIHTISSSGPELVACWMELLRIAIRKALAKMASDRCVPTTYAQCVATLSSIAPYMTPELVTSVIGRQQEREPDDSCSLDRVHGFRPMEGTE